MQAPKRFGIVAAGLALAVIMPQPASAQGFFESLFGGFRSRPADVPHRATAYAPETPFERERRPERRARTSPKISSPEITSGSGPAYCVRLCDGRYFPLQRHTGASAAELCQSFCPASKTMVFHGRNIDFARASNGTRYADLDTAYDYRDKLVDGCTCNGKDQFGLARVDAKTDPTLRAGDIVATNDGLATFRGKNADKVAEFTPFNGAASEWARRLSEIKVRPAPAAAEIPAVDNTPPERQDKRRAQSSR
jgi:hypothetical protein